MPRTPGPSVILSLVAGILLCPSVSRPAETDWKVGRASVKITPDEPVRLVGYSSRTKPSEGVALDLYAKALYLEDGEGARAVVVTSDLIGFRGSFATATAERISEATGLARDQILLNSSHTHCAPHIALSADDLDFPEDQKRATVKYSRDLQNKLVDLVVEAAARPVPARLSWGAGVVNFVMNRREFTERGVQLGVNPRGLADRSVPLLRVDDAAGKALAVLFAAACHNTTLTGEHYQISADFAGYSQALVERELPGAQAMFMQNCGGDANPYPRGSEELARRHGEELGREVLRVLGAELRPVRGPLRTQFEPTALPLQEPPSREEIRKLIDAGSWRGFVGGRMLAALEKGDQLPRTYTAPIALWQFGEDLTLVGLPGEVVVDYAAMLERALGPHRLWVAAYCNDVFGYLPSARVLEEGGYECRGLYAGGVGFFSGEAQRVVVDKVAELARRAGRPSVAYSVPGGRDDAGLDGKFAWRVGDPVLEPHPSGEDTYYSIKDPTIVHHEGRWHLFCSVRGKTRSHQIECISFDDWQDAREAKRHLLTMHDGFYCAPQVFYFRPQKKWYLICQASDDAWEPEYGAAYATTEDLSDPSSWSPLTPLGHRKADGKSGLDFWIICDDEKAHLFFTTLDGRMWREETSLSSFPAGWSEPELALQADIFEASHVYRIKSAERRGGARYLAVIEAQNGHGWRYFKAYVAGRLDGEWTPLAAAKDQAFASLRNTRFDGVRWTDSISHGELLRAGYDERLEVDPARLRFVFQGVKDDDRKGRPYGQIPWRLGLLEAVRE